MHGVGVFDYATIPGVIRTQVYMCPTARCNPEMLAAGDCLTYIQAIAVQLGDPHPSKRHSLVFRNNWMKVDYVDRHDEPNITLSAGVVINASGIGAATERPARVNHEALADCHVLSAVGQVGQLIPKSKRATSAKLSVSQAPALQMRALNDGQGQDQRNQDGAAGGCKDPGNWQCEEAARRKNEGQQRKANLREGGVWKGCTRNEWTLATPALSLDVGVIGPFEQGFLRELVSNRTFNLNVRDVKDVDHLEGIINGDKNGLFKLDPNYNDAENTLQPGQPVPYGPHGHVLEVTAPNVAPEDVLFPTDNIAQMNAACGHSQSLRAIRVADGTLANDDLIRGWKKWKSSSPSQASKDKP